MKLVSIFVSFFIIGLVCANQEAIEARNCSCGQGLYAAWGTWSGLGTCEGQCDNAVLVRDRKCHVFDSESRYHGVELCRLSEPSDCGECAGAWANWGNIGRCSGGCGSGIQLQQRICYRKNTPGRNIRISECAGGNGTTEQTRRNTCTRRYSCTTTTTPTTTTTTPTTTTTTTTTPPTTTTPTTTTTTTTTPTPTTTTTPPTTTTTESTTTTTTTESTTTTKTTTPSPLTRTRSTRPPVRDSNSKTGFVDEGKDPSPENIEKNDEEPSSDTQEKQESNIPVQTGLDTVTLAAVLGSVAIVCVTVVAIAVAIVFLKRHENRKNRAASFSNTSNSSLVHVGSQARRNESNINPMEYALPSETSPYGQVANPLYETTLMNGEPITLAMTNRAFPPPPRVPPKSNENIDIDSVYFSVDGNNI